MEKNFFDKLIIIIVNKLKPHKPAIVNGKETHCLKKKDKKSRSSHQGVLEKKHYFEKFCKINRKTGELRLATLIKKGLRHMSFPVNFPNTSERLFLGI